MIRSNVLNDDAGAVAVEVALVVGVLFSILFGVVEFSLYTYKYNALLKAAERGARTAIVSDAVDSTLFAALTTQDTSTAQLGLQPPYDAFSARNCAGSTQSCSSGQFSEAAFDAIFLEMKRYASFLEPANVTISYTASGVGIAGVSHGILPTVSVTIAGVPHQFIFLSTLGTLLIPEVSLAMTGGDLCSQPPPGCN